MKIKARVKSLDEILKSGKIRTIDTKGNIIFENGAYFLQEMMCYIGKTLDFSRPNKIKTDIGIVTDKFTNLGICAHSYILNDYGFLKEWLEDIENVVDWSKVEVDTKVLVRNYIDEPWIYLHFSKYVDSKVWCWSDGTTSWTNVNDSFEWKYAKLYKEGDNN